MSNYMVAELQKYFLSQPGYLWLKIKMMSMKISSAKYILLLLVFSSPLFCAAQMSDSVYYQNIKTPQLYIAGNQLGYPAINLNSKDQLELHFDDLDADVKSYSYTYQLCNADWTPAIISEFDFIRGFTQMRINEYQLSSLALTKYTHYATVLPDPNCLPTRSGNYILKVFLNGDTSQLAFTRRFLVLDNSVNIAAQILQPFDPQFSRSHQKLQLNVNMRTLNATNPLQQIKISVLQNYRWETAINNIQPTFYSGNNLQYNRDDDFIFPGGSEWRWIDLQSNLRYQSDRIQRGIYGKASTDLYTKPDRDRSRLPYYYFKDYNGMFYIQTTESLNPYWQTDYATVHFSFIPPDNIPFPDKDIYIVGKLTDYKLNDSAKMNFNAEKGAYEASVFMKQGFYNYAYVTIDRKDQQRNLSFEFTEGNHQETENDYIILVYYRDLGGRVDQLVGLKKLNTLTGR